MSNKMASNWHNLLHPGDANDFFAQQTFPPFDTQSTRYSVANARWLMELSRLAYRHDSEEDNQPPQPTRSSFLAKGGFSQIQFFQSKETDTQSMLVQSTKGSYAVLIFRGTEQNSGDIITDIRLWSNWIDALKNIQPFQESNVVCVHEGFRQALDAQTPSGKTVWEEIYAALAQLTCPVYFTGHSLGAALATLAATRPLPHGCVLSAVYTFGSPRVGNQLFVDLLKKTSIYRVVNGDDVVATLPPEILGFSHVGEEHHLLTTEEEFSLSELFSPPKLLADHAPINYGNDLLSSLSKSPDLG